jgi:hypothetical protein
MREFTMDWAIIRDVRDKKFTPNFDDETSRIRTTCKTKYKIKMLGYELGRWTELAWGRVQ